VIPGDLGAELARVLRAAAAHGNLPAAATALTASGTWRPVPAHAGAPAGSYSTSLPFALATVTGRAPGQLAGSLAEPLGAVPWISAAQQTGGGYLTITVTRAHLTGLAARIVVAGPAVARSAALAGSTLTTPGAPDLAAEPSWRAAWRSQRDAVVGQLADAAGAEVLPLFSQRTPAPESTGQAGRSPVPAAVAYFGLDAVRYALARTATAAEGPIQRQLALPLDLANPFIAVRYAHADAASTLRWAAGLGLPAPARPPAPPLAAAAQPLELSLLEAMSWLPERVAAAARRRRPAELAAHLEYLAACWLDCAGSCPALPFRGRGAPADPAGQQALGRLELADAARITLAAGLRLLGIAAPSRL